MVRAATAIIGSVRDTRLMNASNNRGMGYLTEFMIMSSILGG
jgi:hypothetical protein